MVTKPIDRRGPQLVPRDLAIVRWVARHGVVTTEQVAAAFFTGRWAAYRRVRALVALGLLRRDPTFWKEPFVLRVTPAGARFAGCGLAPATLVLAEVRHALALVDLTERLRAAHAGATLVTEREVRAAQLRRWRETGTRPSMERIPDGVLQLASGRRVAIELDLSAKRTREIDRVIAAYLRQYSPEPDPDGFAAVWWYVLPAVAPRVRACVAAAAATDFITVREWIHDDFS